MMRGWGLNHRAAMGTKRRIQVFGKLCHILGDPPKSPLFRGGLLSKGDLEFLNTPLMKGRRVGGIFPISRFIQARERTYQADRSMRFRQVASLMEQISVNHANRQLTHQPIPVLVGYAVEINQMNCRGRFRVKCDIWLLAGIGDRNQAIF